jgi:hypothetical protein
LSKELLDDNYTNTNVGVAANALKLDSFSIYNEYYMVNKYVDADTISNLKLGINSFKLIYPGSAEEMYIALFLPKDLSKPNKSMITAVYSHLSYGWKLTKLQTGLYTITGKTAPELYKLGQTEYNSKYLVSAANTMTLAASCSRPNDIWIYTAEEELYKFFKLVANEANQQYHYPVILDKVTTRPRIIRIYNTTSVDGTYPTICYLTKIDIKNVAAITIENNEIKKVISAALPGIDKNKKFIIYAAYNAMPSSTRSVPHYDIKDVLQ